MISYHPPHPSPHPPLASLFFQQNCVSVWVWSSEAELMAATFPSAHFTDTDTAGWWWSGHHKSAVSKVAAAANQPRSRWNFWASSWFFRCPGSSTATSSEFVCARWRRKGERRSGCCRCCCWWWWWDHHLLLLQMSRCFYVFFLCVCSEWQSANKE